MPARAPRVHAIKGGRHAKPQLKAGAGQSAVSASFLFEAYSTLAASLRCTSVRHQLTATIFQNVGLCFRLLGVFMQFSPKYQRSGRNPPPAEQWLTANQYRNACSTKATHNGPGKGLTHACSTKATHNGPGKGLTHDWGSPNAIPILRKPSSEFRCKYS
ncbi:hypothetical protein CB1_000692008 [Camelus ferus]|nr:hypothetical protein CB1_000692008 [Camelus ferus]